MGAILKLEKSRQNWGMGGHSYIGPLSRDYSNYDDDTYNIIIQLLILMTLVGSSLLS